MRWQGLSSKARDLSLGYPLPCTNSPSDPEVSRSGIHIGKQGFGLIIPKESSCLNFLECDRWPHPSIESHGRKGGREMSWELSPKTFQKDGRL